MFLFFEKLQLLILKAKFERFKVTRNIQNFTKHAHLRSIVDLFHQLQKRMLRLHVLIIVIIT